MDRIQPPDRPMACQRPVLPRFHMDTRNLQNSFCIPTVEGVFDYPTISPDLTRISYVTVVGPGEYYVMIGNLTSEILDRLELDREQ